MSARFAALAVPALLVALAPAPHAAAQATGKRLADVAWISGRWVDDTGGHYSEEVWLGPGGGEMVGVWRLVEWGKVQTFALMSLSEEADGVVLRVRHFDGSLLPREEKDAPVALLLASLQGARAVFEGQGRGGPLRLTYHRGAGRTLVVTIEGDGPKREFRYEKKES
jgi:uncharacterized protein DUF6265